MNMMDCPLNACSLLEAGVYAVGRERVLSKRIVGESGV